MIYKWSVVDIFKILDFTLETDILNGHPKWAQDGQRGKNTYGFVSIVINIAMKEIDRKRSMLRGHVSSNN